MTEMTEAKAAEFNEPFSVDAVMAGPDDNTSFGAIESDVPAEPVSSEPEVDTILASLEARIGTAKNKNRHLKMLVIGDPGTGKTTYSATAPNNLIVDIEKGTAVLVGGEYEDTSILEYKSFFQLEMLIQKLAEGHFPHIETVTIDSLSELSKRGLQELTEVKFANSGGTSNKYVPEVSEYTENNEHMRRIVSGLRDLERNLICISHVKEAVNKKTGVVQKRADFSEKLAGTMNGIFDVVGLLTFDAETGERRMQIQPTPEALVKTRVTGLPAFVEDPKWDIFYSAYRAQHNI
jgi:phage nucleotide-binding protein